jgi:casein kinase II subunit alpha
VLVPLDPKRYVREVKVLQNLSGGPHVIKLLNLIHETASDTFSFVFEWVEFTDWRAIYDRLNLREVKIVVQKVLRALHYAHSNGIMHRDIKPHNIAIDPATLKVRLLDWGLADFYMPRQKYSSHVATRMFKPPELLIEYPYYDYSIDIWSLGLTFAIMLFGKSPIKGGDDDAQQLLCVSEFVGGKAILEYAQSLGIQIESRKAAAMLGNGRKGIQTYIEKVEKGKCPDAVDLLERMMTVDHRKRITAAEALRHPFFRDTGS